MKRRALAAILIALPLMNAAAGAVPRTISKPPPGTTAGTSTCSVGRMHSSSAYNRDLGCLFGNLVLACMANDAPNHEWLVELSDAAYELARRSTTITRTEEAYLIAAAVSVKPLLMSSPTPHTKRQLCSRAESSLESACLAFHCGSQHLRPSSPELNETKRALKDACDVDVPCSRERGLDPARCNESWTKSQDALTLAFASLTRVETNDTYSSKTRLAVRDWAEHTQTLATSTENAIRSYDPLAAKPSLLPVPTRAAETLEKAVPALTAMRQDELREAERQADRTRELYAVLPCNGDERLCASQRQEGRAAVKHLQARILRKRTEMQSTATDPNPDRKLEVLSGAFTFPTVAPPQSPPP